MDKKKSVMNLPNRLTLMRIALVPVYLLILWFAQNSMRGAVAALIVFAAASLTDLLDGKIARKYNLVTNFGKFMDPIADKLLTHTGFIMMLALGRISVISCIVFIAREFVVSGLRLVAVEQQVVIAAGMSGKVKTVLQMILIMLLTLNLPYAPYLTVTRVVEASAVIMTLYSMVEYLLRNRSVLKEA